MEDINSQCPVCLGPIEPKLFNVHMTNHSKEEMVATLLRQTAPAPDLADGATLQFEVFFQTSFRVTVGQKILKSPGQKNS